MSDSKPVDTERQIENMKAVVDVAKAMARFIKVDDLLVFIVGETTKVMDADRSSLFLFDEKTNELWSKIAQGVDLMEIRFPVGAGIAGDVAATRTGSNIPDAYDDPRFNQEFDKKTGYRTKSVLALPIINAEDQLTGVIQVLNKKDDGVFDEQDAELLSALGAQAGVAIEQARLIESQIENERMQEALEVARNIQMSLMPDEAPAVDNFDIFGYSVACDETGGDYYDFVEFSDGRLGIIVGDVSGHGLGAAMFMATARASMRSIMMTEDDPAKILYQVNNRLAWDMSDESFMTLFFGILDPVARTLRYSSAGHEDPLIYRAKDGTFDELESTGLPLGMMEEMDFPEGQMSLFNDGDILLMTTDGVFEAANVEEEMFDHSRMKICLEECHELSSEKITEELKRRTYEFIGESVIRDDITIVTVKANAISAAAEEVVFEDFEVVEIGEAEEAPIDDSEEVEDDEKDQAEEVIEIEELELLEE